jgi:hypothetical protein
MPERAEGTQMLRMFDRLVTWAVVGSYLGAFALSLAFSPNPKGWRSRIVETVLMTHAGA